MRLFRNVASLSARRQSSSLAFANGFNPETLSAKNKLTLHNYVDGSFSTTSNMYDVVDPLNGASRSGCWMVSQDFFQKASRLSTCRAPRWPSWTASWRR